MLPSHTMGVNPILRIKRRYEQSPTRCPECGHVDEERNWTCTQSGGRVEYHHVCPECGADRTHDFTDSRRSRDASR
ncbi:MAG: HVO_0649 family zinc finger protein [Halodesulfurarchaeum sp.]